MSLPPVKVRVITIVLVTVCQVLAETSWGGVW